MSSRRTLYWAGFMLTILLVVCTLAIDNHAGVNAIRDATPTQVIVPDPVMGDLDLTTALTLDLNAYPLVPEISQHALQIYQNGLARGNSAHSFAKVGDCMTYNPYFMIPIGTGDYDLGEYSQLQPTIDNFSSADLNAFSRESQAAAGGFNAASVLDKLWANPQFCEPGETPLSCEFRLIRPSIAIVMFGTNDVYSISETQFDFFLRQIVVESVHNGTLPILSTFPQRPEFPDKSMLFNQIVVQVAQDYDVPLINLWRALEPLPNQGVDPVETTHMTTPASGAVCYFIDENLQAGFTVRNLLTLQTLDAVLNASGKE